MPKGIPRNGTNKGWIIKGQRMPKKTKEKMSESRQGKLNPFYGKTHSEGTIKKIKQARKKQIGEKCPAWKGGVTLENHRLRTSIEFRLWREAVFARDNWTCQKCGIKNGMGKSVELHPHHIKSFAKYPELRFAIDNGITVCKKCHKCIHYKNN